MAPRGGAIWPSAGAETCGGVHPWRDLTGTRSPPYGSGVGCEDGVGSSGFGIRDSGFGIRDSGIGNRESGIGNRESGIVRHPQLTSLVCGLFPVDGRQQDVRRSQPSRRTSLTPGSASNLPSRPDS
ncbi:hypothetical protein CVO74_03955 [Xanthomonas prunicola]|uniref:Uncharacterized protein n=1 Tax=Xanthomonas prunicola TaxID=2053930 RepID=A0A2N3RNA3_9XANT|nr:hypothetical protein XpruCFBP8353_02505 [Xanthomonas prunicola]PKV18277.1 hypothetical protein XpruCFBP8354_02505 [Xanthomonas prunicola]PKV22412.1 hypothetical protein CVO74_03955 [Xanthomonas prunicola]